MSRKIRMVYADGHEVEHVKDFKSIAVAGSVSKIFYNVPSENLYGEELDISGVEKLYIDDIYICL